MRAGHTDGQVAVIGSGINGIAIAWRLAEHGFDVTLFERDRLAAATSSASSKLLHGGLRYLEQGALGLVREGLRERRWWIDHAPHLARPLDMVIPVYSGIGRNRWRIKCGLWLYDRLAGSLNLARHRWLDRDALQRRLPELNNRDLRGGYLFQDGQMDDYRLALWAAEQATACGATIREHQAVEQVDTDGHIYLKDGGRKTFNMVINAAGLWAEQLLQHSRVRSSCGLDLVRGSHLLLPDKLETGLLLQHPDDGRVFFVLPYREQTLVGTTEAPQDLEQPIVCSIEERAYLLRGYNAWLGHRKEDKDILDTFAGLRPLVRSRTSPNRASREYRIEQTGKLITVWGGKWTTARSLAGKVLEKCRNTLAA